MIYIRNFIYLFMTILVMSSSLMAQEQTLGLFLNSEESFDGYTLITPAYNSNTYLINNCGESVHSWPSAYTPGLSAYLLEDGNLLRTRNVGHELFTNGGTGGGLELLDWDGNVIWEYDLFDEDFCQHHDIEVMPNGNILAIVWEARSIEEGDEAGRTNSDIVIFSEKIMEIVPDYDNGGGEIVWEWYVWDHLVQDENADKDNYANNIGDHPELIDINFGGGSSDWLHFNALSYNESLDQILISTLNFSELWVIDHSTTTAEAAGHTGGNSGKGGDLLYRWGNPRAYGAGANSDQKLFSQHNAHWIPEGLLDEGKIMIFNNQAGDAVGQDYSASVVIDPPVQNDGSYLMNGDVYEPEGFHWEHNDPENFYSYNISSTQRLPNGNTLICSGDNGTFFEVDYDGNKVWEYLFPGRGAAQGDVHEELGFGITTWRIFRYDVNYSAFDGKDLTPQGYIESGSEGIIDCTIYPESEKSDDDSGGGDDNDDSGNGGDDSDNDGSDDGGSDDSGDEGSGDSGDGGDDSDDNGSGDTDDGEDSEDDDAVLSSSELAKFSFEIHPNPTTGTVSIETDVANYYVELANIQGQRINRYKAISTINLKNHKDGMYLIRIIDEKGNVLSIQRIIKVD